MPLKPIPLMHIVVSLKPGGLETVVLDLLSRTDRETFSPKVCCLEQRGLLASEAEKMGVEVLLIGKKDGLDLSLIWRLARVLRREKVKIVHSHNRGPWVYAGVAARLAGTPVVIHTQHGLWSKYPGHSPWKSQLLFRFCRKVVTVSDAVKRMATEIEGIPAERVLLIPNGINVKNFRDGLPAWKARAELGLKPCSFLIGLVARLAPEKDHVNLLEAFSLALEYQRDLMLVLIGDGPLRQELEEITKVMGLQEKVTFLGHRTDVPKVLNALDLFVLPSKTEGLSVALLEAMAAGKPVVATEVGGNPEVVVDGETGFIVPPGNPKVLAESLLKIIQNREIAREMGRKGRERVETEYSLDRMANSYQSLYQEMLMAKGITVSE